MLLNIGKTSKVAFLPFQQIIEDTLNIGYNSKNSERIRGFNNLELVLPSTLSFCMIYINMPGTLQGLAEERRRENPRGEK